MHYINDNFFLVRKFGRKFVCAFCDETKVERIENSKLFQNPKKIETIMLILFLIGNTKRFVSIYSRVTSNKAT